MKKLLSMVLSACLIISLIPITAFADVFMEESEFNMAEITADSIEEVKESPLADTAVFETPLDSGHDTTMAPDAFELNGTLLFSTQHPIARAEYKDGTLTFYYDDAQGHGGNPYEIPESGYPGWLEMKNDITKVVFDESFKNYAPVTLANWFEGLKNLTEITDLKYLNTSEAKYMKFMFSGCTSLAELNLSSFDTSSVTDMYCMFNACEKLTKLDLSKFNTSSVTDMGCMFADCNLLAELELSESFDTSEVTNMKRMFQSCKELQKLDLSSFDTSKVRDMSYMFYGDTKLQTVFVDPGTFITSKVTESTDMFNGCTALKGGNETGYNSGKVDIAYARVDIDGDPGYFSMNKEYTYTVTFDQNGGSGDMESVAAVYGKVMPAITLPIRTCYIFEGYYDGTGDTAKQYYDKDGKSEITWDKAADTELIAHWSPDHQTTLQLHAAVAPTCTTEGNDEYYICNTCHGLFTDEEGAIETTLDEVTLPKTGHKMTSHAYKAPTCTTEGQKEYYECNTCHGLFTDEEGTIETTLDEVTLPKTGHKMTSHAYKAPTCTTEGSNEYYTCDTCKGVFKDAAGVTPTTADDEILPELGHDWSDKNGICRRDTSHICGHEGVKSGVCPICKKDLGSGESDDHEDSQDSSDIHYADGTYDAGMSSAVTGTWLYDIPSGIWSFTVTGGTKVTGGWVKAVNPYAAGSQPKASWFYFDESGRMLTGWQWIKDKDGVIRCYYLNPLSEGLLGACWLDGRTPDGYTVDKNGAWTESGKVQTR